MRPGRRTSGGFADDEPGLDHDLTAVGIGADASDTAQESFGGRSPHYAERLAHGGQRWILIGCALNVIKTDDGNVLWHTQPGLAKRTNGSDGRNVVKSEKSGKCFVRCQQLSGGFVSEIGRWRVSFELRSKRWGSAESQTSGGLLDVCPADRSIRTEFLSFDEGDIAMTKLRQMFEGDLGGAYVIENDIGHPLHLIVARDGDDGY